MPAEIDLPSGPTIAATPDTTKLSGILKAFGWIEFPGGTAGVRAQQPPTRPALRYNPVDMLTVLSFTSPRRDWMGRPGTSPRWLAVAALGLAVACSSTENIQDPLAPDAVPTGAEINAAGAAAHQLELQAAAREVQARLSELRASGGWRDRGYFTGSEHDAIEWLLFRFVNIHRAFWRDLDRMGGVELAQTPDAEHPRAHLLVLHAGLALADSSTFLVTEFQEDPVAVAKLNEAFYRSEIPAGTYDQLRLAVTSEGRQEALEEAWALHEQEQRDPNRSPAADAARDPALADIVASLPTLHDRVEQRIQTLDAERDRVVTEIDHSTAAEAARVSGKSFETFGYKTRALVFKDVSRVKSPTAHLIRFSGAQKRVLTDRLRPGDVILTYTAGYASDVFIPGAFKHGITYVGVGTERASAGLTAESVPRLDRPRADRFAANLAQTRMPDGSRADLIEAVAEGVKFSNLERILDTHVNRLLVLRPRIDDAERTAFLAGVFAFLGDPYDFRFDFGDATRQVCTEVIYRALNGRGGIEFTLTSRAGHPTLSADDVVLYHFATPGRFEVVAFAEEDPKGRDHAARVWTGEAASQRLQQRMAELTGNKGQTGRPVSPRSRSASTSPLPTKANSGTSLAQHEESFRRQRVASTFHLPVLAQMEQAIDETIAEGRIPGGVLWIEHEGVPFASVHGYRSLVPTREKMTRDTIFDIASLTKVVATTPAVMKLVEQQKVQLADPAQKFIPEFKGNGKEQITIQQLLTHTSGLRPDISTRPAWSGSDVAVRMASAEELQQEPGTAFRYSDISFFVLSEVVRRASGQPLEEFVQREIYQPLGMNDTGFLPPASKLERIAPTESENGDMLRGMVHDSTARYMGGVAGHAGLFSTIADLAKFCRMLLNEGELDGTRVLSSDTVRLMTSVQSPEAVAERRGLGWDIDSGYSRPRGKHFPIGSYGHTGFTGASLWIDPFSQTFWIFMSNRLHPDGRGNVLPLQARLADLAALAVKDFDFTAVEGALPPRDRKQTPAPAARADVSNGIDVLKLDDYAALRGLKIGLVTNHTGRNRDGTPTVDLLHDSRNVDLVALFSPEHGIRGELDAYVNDGVDEETGLPIYSLYGKRRSPLPEHLAGLDALVFDIQDIGTRFYTYISTMGHAMEAAARAGVKFIVLDRLNPITGAMVEGPVLEGRTDFVGWHAIPVRHGMTVGELARLFNDEKEIGVDLEVIGLNGWKRDMWLDETTTPWIDTSPNMRSLTQATLYPGVGLLETTQLSVGRGTDTPFELFGAPYIDGELLAERMNSFGIRGVRFDPALFTPDASTFEGQECQGVRIALVDRDRCDVINIGIAAALALNQLYPEAFGLNRFGGLLKHPATLEAIRENRPLTEIRKLWEPQLSQFKASRRKSMLYPSMD